MKCYMCYMYSVLVSLQKLANLYERTLRVLSRMPKNAAYRVNTQAIVKNRLQHVQTVSCFFKFCTVVLIRWNCLNAYTQASPVSTGWLSFCHFLAQFFVTISMLFCLSSVSPSVHIFLEKTIGFCYTRSSRYYVKKWISIFSIYKYSEQEKLLKIQYNVLKKIHPLHVYRNPLPEPTFSQNNQINY